MTRGGIIGSVVLILTVVVLGAGLAAWKFVSINSAIAASSNMPEPTEAVATSTAITKPHQRATTAIGTVMAMRSISLRNEIAGTVRKVDLTPGKVVEEGEILVAMDVSVEESELVAAKAQSKLADSMLARTKTMSESLAASATELDKALAERDVALAQIKRIEAIIAKRTIRAPFRARVGLSDVHPGQYLEEATLITTLQGVDESVHVDFSVAQRYAYGLKPGVPVDVIAQGSTTPIPALIVATDSRVDPATRNAHVRAKIADASIAPTPGSSVRVRVPVGPSTDSVFVPASALRKGPSGDHVFILVTDANGITRAKVRPVESGELLGDEVLIRKGVTAGEKIAAAGSFKLREGVLVTIVPDVAGSGPATVPATGPTTVPATDAK